MKYDIFTSTTEAFPSASSVSPEFETIPSFLSTITSNNFSSATSSYNFSTFSRWVAGFVSRRDNLSAQGAQNHCSDGTYIFPI